jgi:hypothetical protein
MQLLTSSFSKHKIVWKFLEIFRFNKNTAKAVQVRESLKSALPLQPISFQLERPNVFIFSSNFE